METITTALMETTIVGPVGSLGTLALRTAPVTPATAPKSDDSPIITPSLSVHCLAAAAGANAVAARAGADAVVAPAGVDGVRLRSATETLAAVGPADVLGRRGAGQGEARDQGGRHHS